MSAPTYQDPIAQEFSLFSPSFPRRTPVLKKWLQWSRYDLENGMGGVEVHARSIARELKNYGIECILSRDADELLNPEYDVIHTHGCASVPWNIWGRVRTKSRTKRPVWIHTLHGSTLGRMKACKEWTWPGGYLAYLREIRGIVQADIVASVNSELLEMRWARRLGKVTLSCSNGWDSESSGGIPLSDQAFCSSLYNPAVSGSWLFLGRGSDPMKGVDILIEAIEILKRSGKIPDFKLSAAPGEGFETEREIQRLGRLNAKEVKAALRSCRGLIVPSRYEGLPLVVIEGLSEGVPVITMPVGGIGTFPPQLKGFFLSKGVNAFALSQAILKADREIKEDHSSETTLRIAHALHNRQLLSTWGKVTRHYINTAEKFSLRFDTKQ